MESSLVWKLINIPLFQQENQADIFHCLMTSHWYLMTVTNCSPETPAYIESKASANFSESSADAEDCCTKIPFFQNL